MLALSGRSKDVPGDALLFPEAIMLVRLVSLALLTAVASAEAQVPDFADLVELGRYYVKPVFPEKDLETGFVIGGKNDTALILKATRFNERSIAELEKDMRPGAKSDVGTSKGFLGHDEKLLDILAMDNRHVVEQLGLTHQELARHLHALGAIGQWQAKHGTPEAEFVYRGRKLKVKVGYAKAFAQSPFRDGTKTNVYAEVLNVATGKKLGYSLLVPHLIERYGFYEGKGTPYRVDPARVIEVLDFLVERK